jgi:hypothetical protein
VEVEMRRVAEANLLPSERQAMAREAAGGLYGYTKRTQRDVEVSVRKAKQRAVRVASALHAKDSRALPFLQAHVKRSSSRSAKLLLLAMTDVSRTAALLPVERAALDEEPRLASDKVARGLYGFTTKTARRCLNACTDFRTFVGEVSYDLHSRRTARYAKITGYLKEHSKTAKCGYSRLLLASYPEGPVARVASDDEAEVEEVEETAETKEAGKLPDALKEHQFTSEDNPNPEGNDKDGDGKKNEKKPFDDKKAADEAPRSVEAGSYARKSMRGGDYGGAESSAELAKDMIHNMQWASTPAEVSHATDQLKTALASKSITSKLGDEVEAAIGSKKASVTASADAARIASLPTGVNGWLEWQE